MKESWWDRHGSTFTICAIVFGMLQVLIASTTAAIIYQARAELRESERDDARRETTEARAEVTELKASVTETEKSRDIAEHDASQEALKSIKSMIEKDAAFRERDALQREVEGLNDTLGRMKMDARADKREIARLKEELARKEASLTEADEKLAREHVARTSLESSIQQASDRQASEAEESAGVYWRLLVSDIAKVECKEFGRTQKYRDCETSLTQGLEPYRATAIKCMAEGYGKPIYVPGSSATSADLSLPLGRIWLCDRELRDAGGVE